MQQLFRDVEDEEAWIREKEPIIASTNRGKDLIGVRNLIKKHQVTNCSWSFLVSSFFICKKYYFFPFF